jgi:purine catabolism regulator
MAATLTERIRSLGHIANLISAGHELGEVLSLIVTAVCQRSSWSSGAIMAADETIGFSVLVARFDPLFVSGRASVDKWQLATSPIRTVLASRRPIVIENAQNNSDFAGYRQEAIERDYHTVVLLPFSTVDAQERGLVLSVHSHEHRVVDEEEMVFLETVAMLGSLAVEKARRTRSDALQRARLLQALDISQMAMDQVLGTEDMAGFVALAERYLQAPFLLADFVTHRLFRGGGASETTAGGESARLRELQQRLRATDAGQFDRIDRLALDPRFPEKKQPMLLEPCIAAGQVLGGFALLTDKALSAEAALTAQQLRAACTVLLLRQHIRFEAEAETHGAFFARLFSADWRDGAAMLARARHLGLHLDEPGQLAAVSLYRADAADEIEQAIARDLRRLLPGAAAFRDNQAIILFLPLQHGDAAIRRILEQVLREVEWLTREAPIACLGQECRRLEDYPPARRQIATLMTLAERVGRSGIAEAADFGPLARLVALADAIDLRSFVDDIIGRIAAHDHAHGGDLLVTLEQYLAHSMRLQATADALSIHVTTLRYRLGRMTDLFGFDLANAETRLGLELALRLRRLLD